MDDDLGLNVTVGGRHHRAFVGEPTRYDVLAALQFNVLTSLGLREHHSLLDIGCGSLRAGRLFLMYLLPEKYCGVEPEEWLVEEGIKREIGADLIALKRPSFNYSRDFDLSSFGRTFDYVLAQSVFTHASRSQIVTCMTAARRVMTPASVFIATYLRGDTDYDGLDWVYPECVPYRESSMQSMAADCGLTCVPLTYPHPAGVSWISLSVGNVPAAIA